MTYELRTRTVGAVYDEEGNFYGITGPGRVRGGLVGVNKPSHGRRVLTKLPFGRFQTVAMDGDHTTHHQYTLECSADGQQIGIVNGTGVDWVNVKASIGAASQAGGGTGGNTANAGINTVLRLNGQDTFTVKGAGGTNDDPIITWLDWAAGGSISAARTDRPGALPLHVVRVEIPLAGNANRTGYLAAASLAGWATENLTQAPYGRILRMRKQAGLFATVAAAAGFNTTAFAEDALPIIVRYLPRAVQGATVMTVGNSVTEGAGADCYNAGWWLEAQNIMSTQAAPVEFVNFGQGGAGSAAFSTCVERFASEIMPTVCTIQAFNTNDAPATITTTSMATTRHHYARSLAALDRLGIGVAVEDGIPSNPAIRPWGATDALRVARNAEVYAQEIEGGPPVMRFARSMSGETDGAGQVLMLNHADNIHPNTVGYRDAMAPQAVRVLKRLL